MLTRSRLLFIALTAALLLAAAVSASGHRLAGSSSTGRTTFVSLEFIGGGFFTIRCPVTLEGRAHSRTISKVSGQLVGYITSAFVRSSSCTGGSATIFGSSLPWHVRYDSFAGALPNITSGRSQIVGARFRIEAGGFGTCEATTSASSPGFAIGDREAGGVVTGGRAGGTVPLTGCFASTGTFSGSGTATDQTGARVTVTLVA
jgi:hypothetical protein